MNLFISRLSIFSKSVWLYFAGLLSVIVLYFLLIGLGQGIDLVIQSGEYFFGPGFFLLISIVLWSYMLWYSGRILSYVKQQKQYNGNDELPISTFLHKHFPRIISYNCYVCIGAAIVSLPTTYDLNGYGLALFIVIHNLIYFFLTSWFEIRNKLSLIIALVLLLCCVTAYVFLGMKELLPMLDTHYMQLKLRGLLLLFFILQLSWLYFIINRRKNIDTIKAKEEKEDTDTLFTKIHGRVMLKLGFREDYIAVEKQYFKFFSIVSLISLTIYIVGIFNITTAIYIGTLAYVILAFGILVSITNFISFINIRLSLNLFIALFIWSFVMGIFIDPYQVNKVYSKKDFSYSERPETRAYLDLWFKKRIALMKAHPSYVNDSTAFDAYIVLSNGGASRAGYWASSVMCSLQDISYAKDKNNSFKDHLLCLSGASGGSVGNAAFYGILKAAHDNKNVSRGDFTGYNEPFFSKDFLVFPVAHLLGPDLLQHIIPMTYMDDRGDALERSLSEARMEAGYDIAHDTLLTSYFKKPLSEIFDQSGELPLFYITSTEVDNGKPGLICNVKLPSKEFNSQRTDILRLIDSLKVFNKNNKIDIRFSTAAILSSRFPYVSPAVKVYNRYFVDGGYFDNSGAGSVFEFTEQLIAYLNRKAKSNDPDAKYYARFTFHLLHLNNSELFQKPVKDINPVNNDLISPILTLVGIQGSSTATSNGILSNYFAEQFSHTDSDLQEIVPTKDNNQSIEYNLYHPLDRIPSPEENYPMSWVISEYQMARMRKALERENCLNFKKFYFMNLKKQH